MFHLISQPFSNGFCFNMAHFKANSMQIMSFESIRIFEWAGERMKQIRIFENRSFAGSSIPDWSNGDPRGRFLQRARSLARSLAPPHAMHKTTSKSPARCPPPSFPARALSLSLRLLTARRGARNAWQPRGRSRERTASEVRLLLRTLTSSNTLWHNSGFSK